MECSRRTSFLSSLSQIKLLSHRLLCSALYLLLTQTNVHIYTYTHHSPIFHCSVTHVIYIPPKSNCTHICYTYFLPLMLLMTPLPHGYFHFYYPQAPAYDSTPHNTYIHTTAPNLTSSSCDCPTPDHLLTVLRGRGQVAR